MNKILCYGSLNLDYVYEVEHFVEPGETLASKNMKLHCGGKGLNQSIAAARAGGQVYHAGKLGSNGEPLKELLKNEGIDISYLRNSDLPNGHAIIQVDSSGQNSILLYAGSNHDQTKSEIDETLKDFSDCDYLILQNEINELPYLIEKAYEKKLTVVFNPSPITEELFKYPIDKVSLLILNETEGKELSNKTEPEEIINALYEKFGTDVLLTLGKDGAVYYNGDEKIYQGVYKTKIVDTTAAGDTITGCFIQMLASGKSPKEALMLASKAAAITISRAGAAPSIPTLKEVNEFSPL